MFRKKYKYIEYPVCGKCKYCWYWRKDEEQSLTTEYGTIVMGECGCQEVCDFIWHEGERDKPDNEVGPLYTHETFGCGSWTEEEPD